MYNAFMVTQNYKLIVIAHPDDETLFFSGLIQSSSGPWKVICVTDGNADKNGLSRSLDFKKACEHHKIHSFEQWDFPDIYENRLELKKLMHKLQELEPPTEVYTHGILGEYGHPHHQDVSYCVHEVFASKCDVWSVAYNLFPEKIIQLDKQQYEHKMFALTEIYKSETIRFLNLLPVTFVEGFIKVSKEEVEHLYESLVAGNHSDVKKLDIYKPIAPHIENIFFNPKRMF